MVSYKWMSLQFILCVLGYYFIRFVNYICPWYVPWVYKYAGKARKVVYNRWVTGGEKYKDRLWKFYGYSGRVDGVQIDRDKMLLTFELAHPEWKINKKVGNTKQYYSYSIKYQNYIIAKLSYYFYYFFVWMWLDDYNIINGIDIRLFNRNNDIYKDVSGKDVLNLVNGTKVYDVVLEHLDSKEVVPFSTRYFCARHITTPNLLRDLGTNSESIVHMFNCKYDWNRKLERHAIHLFGRCLITGD